jgi:predicted nucleic-acid-binding protein
MIGIDANVLVCALVNTADPDLTARARKAIIDNAPVFVNSVALMEFAWVCKRTYKLGRSDIHRKLEAILVAPEFQFSEREAIARAVAGYGSRMSDFADWLIGETNLDHGCSVTLTFDKGAAKGAAFKSVPV